MIASALQMVSNLGLLSLGALGLFCVVSRLDAPTPSHSRRVALGVILGVISLMVVNFPIEGPFGSRFDTRAAPIIMAGFFGGPVTGVMAASIGGAGRYMVGGPAVVGGVVSVYVYAAVGLFTLHLSRRVGIDRLGIHGWAVTAVAASIAVIPTFFIMRPFDTAVAVIEAFWPIFFGGNVIGIVILGSILETLWSRENRARRYATAVGVASDRMIARFSGAEDVIHSVGRQIAAATRDVRSSAAMLRIAVADSDASLAGRMIDEMGAGLARLDAIVGGLDDVERATKHDAAPHRRGRDGGSETAGG